MSEKLTIKITFEKDSDPDIYQLLESIKPRRRAERIRLLAAGGLNKFLKDSKPTQDNKTTAAPKDDKPGIAINTFSSYQTGQDDFSQLSEDITKNLG